MNVFALLEEAIETRSIVAIGYKGSRREVEPHLLGTNLKGNLTLSAFQLYGGSGTAFRSYLLSEITFVENTGENFLGPRSGYNPNDGTMSDILVRL